MIRILSRWSVGLLATLFPFVYGPALAADPSAPPPGEISGIVVDAESGEPLVAAIVVIVELNRTEKAHGDGSFHFHAIQPGSYSLRISRIGYQSAIRTIRVPDSDTVALRVELRSTVLEAPQVIVRGDRMQRSASDVVISGKRLQQQLGTTVAETMSRQPGISQSSMGPAASRPVVRGLGGDRLLILDDGAPTGDLSTSSPDHAVAIDPIGAERIEIHQGPSALLYGANVLGGVIDLVREQIASNLPDRVHGNATLAGQSASSGYSGALTLSAPIGPIASQLMASGRSADDISTPIGTLGNTDILTYDGSLGLSYVQPWGHAGLAGGIYRSEYGVPSAGEEEGVRIVMNRTFGELRSDLLPNESWLRRIELSGSATKYDQQELESTGEVGTEFHVSSSSAAARFHHDTLEGFGSGSLALSIGTRDYSASGEEVTTPSASETGVGVALFEEVSFDDLWAQGAVRYDLRRITPEVEGPAAIGNIRQRTFGGFSGSIALGVAISDGFNATMSLMKTFRPPTLEELYTDGPHLAAYSVEVGNPDLDAEHGLGIEGTLRYSAEAGHASLSLFRNDMTGYIFPRNTGDTNQELGLPIYQHTGERAIMTGGELAFELEVVKGFVALGGLAYVRGELTSRGTPLPSMPPLTGRFGVRYQDGPLTLSAISRGAARQDRLGEFETATAGYLLFDLQAQYQLTTASTLHTIVLSVDNLTDVAYRNHLSRIKEIMPETGRDVRLAYRVFF